MLNLEKIESFLDRYGSYKIVSQNNDKELICYEVIDDKDFQKYGLYKFVITIQGVNLRYNKRKINYPDFVNEIKGNYNDYFDFTESQKHRMYNIYVQYIQKKVCKYLQTSLKNDSGLI